MEVSRAETAPARRRPLLEAAAELGYRPDRTASLLARRRTHLVGVLLDIRSPFHAELVEDLQEAAEGQGYDIVLSTVTRTRDERPAMRGHGLADHLRVLPGDHTEAAGSRAARTLLDGEELPSAVVASNDRSA